MTGRQARALVGLRLARREAVRRPWRTALVILMVALPVAGMTIGATLFRTSEWSATDRRAAEYGTADAYADLQSQNWAALPEELPIDTLAAGLPARSRVLVERTTGDRVRLDDRAVHLRLSDLPLDDPAVTGRFDLLDGRYPSADDEVAITEPLARELGQVVGDTMTTDRLGVPLTITGVVRSRAHLDRTTYVRTLDLPASDTEVLVDLPGRGRPSLMPTGSSIPVAPDVAWVLQDLIPVSGNDRSVWILYTYLGGAAGLLALGTVIAAAFAVGARDQLRTFGLLSSAGTSPATLRRFLVLQGLLAGVLGAGLGVVAGLGLLRLASSDRLTHLVGRPVGGAAARTADLVPIVVIGVIAAVVAAWWPARSAARVGTLEALAGRRPQSAVPGWVPVFGLVAIAVGCLLLVTGVDGIQHLQVDGGGSLVGAPSVSMAIGGVFLLGIGVLAFAPWVVGGLERLTSRSPSTVRLAGRSLGRSRARSSAIVGSVCVVAAGAVAATTVHASLVDDAPEFGCRLTVANNMVTVEGTSSTGVDPADLNHVREILPDAAVVPIQELQPRLPATPPDQAYTTGSMLVDGDPASGEDRCMEEYQSGMYFDLATPALLDAFDVPDQLRDALADGAAVTLALPPPGATEVQVTSAHTGDGTSTVVNQTTVPYGGAFADPTAYSLLSAFLLAPATAERLDLTPADRAHLLLANDGPLTEAERRALTVLDDDSAWAQAHHGEPGVRVGLPTPDDALRPGDQRTIGLAVAVLVVGAIVAAGLALAAKDNEAETSTLIAVGASPRTLRRLGALRPLLLLLSAGIVAAPVGLVAAWAIVEGWNIDLASAPPPVAFRVDPRTVALIVVVLPLSAALVALTGGWVRQHVRSPWHATLEVQD